MKVTFFKKDIGQENRKRLRKVLDALKSKNCPDGWQFKHFSVGGLTEVGFSETNPNLLLVISGNGRGLFDCSKLEKIERDYNNDFEIDYSSLICLWSLERRKD